MPKPTRKTLPKDVVEQLARGDIAALKMIFEKCVPNATGGVFKQTALAFPECPDELARWLITQGADIHAPDTYGDTPLHSRAGHWKGGLDILIALGANLNVLNAKGQTPLHRAARAAHENNVRRLLAAGAAPDLPDRSGHTPLSVCLRDASNATLARVAPVAQALLDAGAKLTDDMPTRVASLGKDFEFHRDNFNRDSVDAASAALIRLYELCAIRPAARQQRHDGAAPIVASAIGLEDRHQELWQWLVPSSGPAATVQGEVIRISGRVHIELHDNGAANWDSDYRDMLAALIVHLGSGAALTEAECTEAAGLAKSVRQNTDAARRLCELAVLWVALNPLPTPLVTPRYRR
jgi:Ankyrin repeats (many copies)